MRLAILGAMLTASVVGKCDELPVLQKEQPMRVGIRHIEAGGIGYDTGYTSLDLFLGHFAGNYFPFFDFRGHYFDNGKWAANGGFGVRFLPDAWDTVLGLNTYYDYRQAYHTNFQQAGLGMEVLRNHWEARINGYLPFKNRSSPYYDTEFAFFEGNQIYLKSKKHVSMAGGDAEFGYTFLREKEDFSLFVGIGPYLYHATCGNNAFGGRFRATAKWKEYISADLIETYDNVFHNNIQGQIAFTFPFGIKSNKPANLHPPTLARRIVEPVVRDEIIVLSKCVDYPLAKNPSTKDPYFVLFVDNQSHSQGTFESPFNTLAAAQIASSNGDIIYVFPGDGTTTGMDAGISLLDNQQLLGSSIAQTISTTLGTITIPAQTSGFSPIIANDAGAVVTVANNNIVSGFYIQYLDGAGLTNGSAQIKNLTAMHNTFQEALGNTAIDLSQANVVGTVLIANNSFNTGDASILITSSNVTNAQYSLSDNIFVSSAPAIAVQLEYTDCSGITTNLSGNTFLAGQNECLAITISNSSAPTTQNQFSLINNDFYSSEANATITLSNLSNTQFAITSNKWLSPIQALSYTVNDTASTTIAFNQNTANNSSNNTFTPCISVGGDTTGTIVFNAADNTVCSNTLAFALGNSGSPIQLGSASFNGNIINSSFETIAVFYTTTSGPIAITNNTCTTYINDPNTLDGAGSGIFVQSSIGSDTSITIADNYSSSNNYGISIELNDSDTGTIIISRNTAVAQDTSSGINFTTSGATPLIISDNTVISRGGGIILNLNNSTDTLVTSSITNNLIQATGGGGYSPQNAIDITVSSTEALVRIEGNTATNLNEQGIALHSNGPASYVVLNNSFYADQQALFLQTSTSDTCSIDAEQNLFFSTSSNASEFQCTSNAPLIATIKDNQYKMNQASGYSAAEIYMNYSNDSPESIASVSIIDNTFIGNDTQVEIAVGGSDCTMNATIASNLFSISGNINSSPALSLTSADSAASFWKVQENTFTSFVDSAATITGADSATTCLTFTDNIAQPIPNAYTFTNTSSSPFTVAPLTGNTGQITSTGTIPGSCP